MNRSRLAKFCEGKTKSQGGYNLSQLRRIDKSLIGLNADQIRQKLCTVTKPKTEPGLHVYWSVSGFEDIRLRRELATDSVDSTESTNFAGIDQLVQREILDPLSLKVTELLTDQGVHRKKIYTVQHRQTGKEFILKLEKMHDYATTYREACLLRWYNQESHRFIKIYHLGIIAEYMFSVVDKAESINGQLSVEEINTGLLEIMNFIHRTNRLVVDWNPDNFMVSNGKLVMVDVDLVQSEVPGFNGVPEFTSYDAYKNQRNRLQDDPIGYHLALMYLSGVYSGRELLPYLETDDREGWFHAYRRLLAKFNQLYPQIDLVSTEVDTEI